MSLDGRVRQRQFSATSGHVCLASVSDQIADIAKRQRCANSGHRKLLHLCFRGSKFNDGNQSNQNEDEQHSGLRDREGQFGLRWSQRIESRNLHEALNDQNEDIKIERHNSGDYVAPCAYQVLFVQGKQGNGRQFRHPKPA
jgi:hypothetical protein